LNYYTLKYPNGETEVIVIAEPLAVGDILAIGNDFYFVESIYKNLKLNTTAEKVCSLYSHKITNHVYLQSTDYGKDDV
jgi:hypothetical protein